MSDIKQSKSILAKLLATENLTVEHRCVPTASFDTHNRVLTLPVWEGTSNNVYDLLVGHEVGHAIYTPDLVGSDINLPQSYLNVIEDARIEKLMKRKYPGLARSFYRGYTELNDQDFFEIKSIDVNTLKFIDRINLYFKLGSVNSGSFISFTAEEKVIVDKVSTAETFDDVVKIVKELVEHIEEETNIELTQSGTSGQSQGEMGDSESSPQEDDSTVTQDQNQSSTQSDSENKDIEKPEHTGDPSAVKPSEPVQHTSDTDNAWTKNQKQLVNLSNNNYIYLIPPEINVDKCTITWQEFGNDLPEVFTTLVRDASSTGYHSKEYYRNMFSRAESAYAKYKDECKKSVAYLIKEFEMKKRATEYNRSAVAGTGVLDTNKMYSYKWNDDIFKKVTVVPKGKSHGLIMHIDWSGSMQENLVGTIKQLFNLIQFCKKTQIPFEVYSFNERNVSKNYAQYSRNSMKTKLQDNQIYICNDFLLVNFLSSKMNSTQLEKQMKNIWKLAYILDHRIYLPYEYNHYDLGSTPLNECIFASIPLFDKFKKTYKVDKVNTVFLTDGESNNISFNRPSYPGASKNIVHAGWTSSWDVLCLQDRKNKITMMNINKNGNIGVTAAFVDYYRQVTGSNAVGFRLIDFYQARSFVARNLKDEYSSWSDVSAQWAKTKSFTSTSMGYNELYFIQIGDDNDHYTATTATPTVTTAFKTQMSKKAFNKIILSKFVEQIA